ncbi:hypothetical protein ACFL1H_04435, partial [Nanoarchaeota archaeon]
TIKIKNDNITIENKKKELGKKVIDLQNSREFNILNRLKRQKDDVDKKVSDHKKTLFNLFSLLEKAMKKYKHISVDHERLIDNYLDNAVNALSKDPNFEIVDAIKRMQDLIKRGEIELKDKKQIKTLDVIGKLNKNYLKEFLEIYDNLKKQKHEFEEKISSYKIEQDINDVEKKISVIDHQLERANIQLENSNAKKEKINTERLKSEIKQMVVESLNVELKIV